MNQNQNKNLLQAPQNTVAIYTVLCILRKMRDQLGLKAMLEYSESYLQIIERHNPGFKSAVTQAVDLLNMEKMYREHLN